MPNHVMNRIKMKGIRELDLFTTDSYGQPQFDFNKLIPMPKELDLTSGSTESDAIDAVLYKVEDCRRFNDNGLKYNKNEYKFSLKRSGMNEKDLLELGLKYISNIVKYGASTWYDWCLKHWGTKWNAYETVMPDDEPDSIMFMTAWSDPTPIVEKLADMFPNRTIVHEYADEDYGSNAGYREYDGTGWSDIYYEDGDKETYEKMWGVLEEAE